MPSVTTSSFSTASLELPFESIAVCTNAAGQVTQGLSFHGVTAGVPVGASDPDTHLLRVHAFGFISPAYLGQ